VQAAVDALVDKGRTYEDGGALWFRSTDFGDDKDRVMRKSEGGYTYFVPDIAYHVAKWRRGFERAVNVQGSDHHGTIARVRAGLQALDIGIPAGWPDYVLHKMVRVVKGGEEVKMSKRAGTGVTLRDLLDMTASGDTPAEAAQRARDAVRYFLVSRKADSEYTFDVDLALSRGDENPVWYVQYAHARICSVFEKLQAGQAGQAEAGAPADALDDASLARADLEPLGSAHELALMAKLAEYPSMVASACDELAPHAVAFWLRELAAELHGFYNAERVLVDDARLRTARLALLAATRQVLRNGLALLGVSAPERM
jgi:arginyl-tRNA synthetase